jgi:membrane-associated phospholipid phosphatase
MSFRATTAVGMLTLVTACGNEHPYVAAPPTPLPAAVHFWESNAAADWMGVARSVVVSNQSNPFVAIRAYAIVGLAQYQAASAAESAKDGQTHPSVHAAISAASVVALSYLYPAAQSSLESQLDQYLAAEGAPGSPNESVDMGEAAGRDAASAVVARAQTDRFFASWTGQVPTGPGLWFSATPPVGAMFGQAKTFFLTSGSQFRPPPPPAFGSPEFNAALAEVRQISDTRTAEQIAIAQFWVPPAPTFWNAEAIALALKYHLDERTTAHLFALLNMVAYDCVVASHEAKFFYWLIRPSQADPGIVLPISLPNFPSYPSNHAAISQGMASIIANQFPAETARLDALAYEAAWSRVLGGIHYWFDGLAGLELGRKVAAWGLAHDVTGHSAFVLTP